MNCSGAGPQPAATEIWTRCRSAGPAADGAVLGLRTPRCCQAHLANGPRDRDEKSLQARTPGTVTRRSSYDAIIVGGGPAGLSAALLLGRCRRTVLLCDTGRPRNAASRALHGFLSRDGIQDEEGLGPDPPRRTAKPTRLPNIRIGANARGDSR
jgi:hypothetical protein